MGQTVLYNYLEVYQYGGVDAVGDMGPNEEDAHIGHKYMMVGLHPQQQCAGKPWIFTKRELMAMCIQKRSELVDGVWTRPVKKRLGLTLRAIKKAQVCE